MHDEVLALYRPWFVRAVVWRLLHAVFVLANPVLVYEYVVNTSRSPHHKSEAVTEAVELYWCAVLIAAVAATRIGRAALATLLCDWHLLGAAPPPAAAPRP